MTAPVVFFTSGPVEFDAPLVVGFYDFSDNDPTAWAWDFGDGATATEQSPTHEYARQGRYEVTLVASNVGGSDSLAKAIIVGPQVDTRGHGQPDVVRQERTASVGNVPATSPDFDATLGEEYLMPAQSDEEVQAQIDNVPGKDE
jgi:PKD repeat protein